MPDFGNTIFLSDLFKVKIYHIIRLQVNLQYAPIPDIKEHPTYYLIRQRIQGLLILRLSLRDLFFSFARIRKEGRAKVKIYRKDTR